MCFNSLTTMQLAVYAFCGLHSLNVLLLPGYMVSLDSCISFLKPLLWVSVFRSFQNREFSGEFILIGRQRPSLSGLFPSRLPFPYRNSIIVTTLHFLLMLKMQGLTGVSTNPEFGYAGVYL